MTISDLKMYCAANYRIKVSGVLDQTWFSYHDNMAVEEISVGVERPYTTLTGQLIDQAALISILNHLYDLQLPILSVEYLIEA